MSEDNLTKEQRILRVMRKVLSSIVKDTTPKPGMLHPLSDQTIEDIKGCFALISVREAELYNESPLRPVFADEPRTATVIPLGQTGLKKKRPQPEGDDGNDAA
ncbi:MAG: segregation and condensation protein A [Sulfuricella sp.]|nr:segregation and condensation protein A [Sulfuricella sp.]